MTTQTIGDTLILMGQKASQWETPRGLVLDVVIAGDDEESGPALGHVEHVAVGPSGRVVVEDVMISSVFRFSAQGEFRDSLGRRGDGPGEYRYPLGVAVLRDGRIIVQDSERPRFLLYDSLGNFRESWPMADLVRRSQRLDVDENGNLAVAFLDEMDVYTPTVEGLVILSPEGNVVDSIPPPPTPWDGREQWGNFHAKKHIAWHPSGFPVVGVSDEYHFDLRRPDRTIRIEQPYKRVPVSIAEKDAFDIEMTWRRRRTLRFIERVPPPPEYKAAYRRILVARTGDIWVFRHGRGEQWTTQDLGQDLLWPRFREPLQVDVFDRDGRFLGVVEADASIDPKVVSNDTVWAVVTGEFDQHYVARYLVR